jgi:hypothetical protein
MGKKIKINHDATIVNFSQNEASYFTGASKTEFT